MYVKFKAYPQNKSLYTNEEGDHLLGGWRDTAILECEEVRHRNWWVSSGGELQSILEAEGEFSVVWELPIYESNVRFPGDGLSLDRVIMFSGDNPREKNFSMKTYFAYDCEIYLMSESGKTIDKLHAS